MSKYVFVDTDSNPVFENDPVYPCLFPNSARHYFGVGFGASASSNAISKAWFAASGCLANQGNYSSIIPHV